MRDVYVCDNASHDNTAKAALNQGAKVVYEGRSGYGYACLRGISEIARNPAPPDIVVFLDGDYSDYPEEMSQLVDPIIHEGFDLVIGSRATGNLEKGAMTPQQIFGNWLATNLIRMLYGYDFTDLGPFRAISWDKLRELDMKDTTYGWTVEMQVKAAKLKMKTKEIPVKYRKRIGKSKISGTVKGTILAGHKILWTIFKLM